MCGKYYIFSFDLSGAQIRVVEKAEFVKYNVAKRKKQIELENYLACTKKSKNSTQTETKWEILFLCSQSFI